MACCQCEVGKLAAGVVAAAFQVVAVGRRVLLVHNGEDDSDLQFDPIIAKTQKTSRASPRV